MGLIICGWRFLRYEHASIWLTCHAQECTLDVTPRGNKGTTTIQFPRRQLVRVESVKTDKRGMFVAVSPRLDDFNDVKKGGKGPGSMNKQKTSYKGPDLDGNYPSYRIVLRDGGNNKQRRNDDDDDDDDAVFSKETDLSPIRTHAMYSDGDLSLIMRKFKIHQSRRRVTTVVKKIDSYIKNRRQRLVIKENSAPCWQGIVCMIIGLLGFLLSLLLGQFWDGEDYLSKASGRQGGPGARRAYQELQAKKLRGTQRGTHAPSLSAARKRY